MIAKWFQENPAESPLASSIPSATMAARYASVAKADPTIWIQPITAVQVDALQQQICKFLVDMIIHKIIHCSRHTRKEGGNVQAGNTFKVVHSQFGQDNLYVAG